MAVGKIVASFADWLMRSTKNSEFSCAVTLREIMSRSNRSFLVVFFVFW